MQFGTIEAVPQSETREQFETRIIEEVLSFAEAELYPATVLIPDEENPGKFIEVKVPFHNFKHARGVYDKAMEYCDYAEANGKKVDRFAVGLAAILHDARYVDDLEKASESLKSWGVIRRKLSSKEQYSAVISGLLLEDLDVDQRTISKVQKLIRKTHKDAKPKSLEEKILVRSDLDNITLEFNSFFKGTLKLVEEMDLLAKANGKPTQTLPQKLKFLHNILSQYISNDLCFGDFDKDIYDRIFRNPAVSNIAELLDQYKRTLVISGTDSVKKLLESLKP